MKLDLRITKELVEHLEKLTALAPQDLKLKDYERGYKAGQIELVQKIRSLYEKGA